MNTPIDRSGKVLYAPLETTTHLQASTFTPREDSSELRQIENRKILSILTELNNQELIAFDNKAELEKRRNRFKEIITQAKDPLEAARLIIVSCYLVYPQDARTVAIDCQVECGIGYMENFIEQEHFLEAMLLIESAIRLDGGESYIFTEILSKARHIKGVNEKFEKRLELRDNQIKTTEKLYPKKAK